ncbi:MAG: CDP-alcohol phosphatidyltransferase family protein [Rhodospirillaceae bacterium]
MFVAAGCAVVLTGAATLIGNFSTAFFAAALGPYLLGAYALVSRIGAFHPHARFGPANTLTLIRLMLACLLAGFAADLSVNDGASQPWLLFALAATALVLDGLDGMAARESGLASTFGARFDMETDAFLILVLCVLALALGKAGPWVLAGGIMRYAYVAAGMVWPVLTGPLPPTWRRKVIAVLQGGVLTVLLTPIITPPLSGAAAAVALLLLTYSFGVDILLLMRARRP